MTPSEIKTQTAALKNVRAELAKALGAVNKAIQEIQMVCEHEHTYLGESSHRKFYICLNCDHETV